MPHIYSRNCPFSFNNLHPHLIHPPLDLPQCHSTRSGQTDRQIGLATSLLQELLIRLIVSDAANNISRVGYVTASVRGRLLVIRANNNKKAVLTQRLPRDVPYSDRTIRQYAHGLLLESTFIPSIVPIAGLYRQKIQKLPSLWPLRRNRK